MKDIIDNINASSLTDKNSLLEQAYLKEIELSDTFDNIYGRVRDINASDLDADTKSMLTTAAQNRLKEIYISRMNKETDRAKIRDLSKEIFNATKNSKNTNLGVEIITPEMLDELFDAIETRTFAMDISDGSYVRKNVPANGVITKTAMLEMKEKGDYPKVNRETGELESAKPYITRITEYIQNNNLEASVQESLRVSVREQFEKLLGISSEQVLTDEMIDTMVANVTVNPSDSQETWAKKAIDSLFYDDAAVNELIDNIKLIIFILSIK